MPIDPQVIEQIHATGRPLVLAVTGGGSGALAALLQTPGASASVLEARIPYSASALRDWLGGTPERSCSERTARAMAMAAFERARELSDVDPRTLRGIGATASLATIRPKRGSHRIHIAWQSAETTAVSSLELKKGARTRAEEESIATELTLSAVAEASGIGGEVSCLESLLPEERLANRRLGAPAAWTRLLLGETPAIVNADVATSAWEDVAERTPYDERLVLFSGAFNPVHEGHQWMAEIAAERGGGPVTWELSMMNVDKPALDFLEINDRLSQLGGRRVMLSRAATFAEKAEFAPGSTFVIGMDTMVRIVSPQYYADDVGRRDAAVRALVERGCRFLVFGRAAEGKFRRLDDLDVPPALRAICEEVPESEFRLDVSSSQLRTG